MSFLPMAILPMAFLPMAILPTTQQTPHVKPMLAQGWSPFYEPYENSYH